MNNFQLNSKEFLEDELINKILIVTAIVATIAFISAQLRALSIGWTLRDAFQLFLMLTIIILTTRRHKLDTFQKASFLIIVITLAAFTGVYSLGMLGGSIFFFPSAAVLIAVFYSVKVTRIYYIFALTFCAWIAYRFSTGRVVLPFSADQFMTNYYQWIVYLVCIAFFFVISCQTIQNYRKTMQKLIETISLQRDELHKTNEQLVEASKNVKVLQGLLPICSSCKKIRDDQGYWNQIETYLKQHTNADFSHSICPECAQKLYPEFYKKE